MFILLDRLKHAIFYATSYYLISSMCINLHTTAHTYNYCLIRNKSVINDLNEDKRGKNI